MTEPIIRVADIAWCRIQSPVVDKQEEFLPRFGMVRAERTDDKLFMRGPGSSHPLHITEKGDPGFISLAFRANSEDDLHKLAAEAETASAVEELDEPGGGKRVRLIEPNGYTLEVVHGVEEVEEISFERNEYNLGNMEQLQACWQIVATPWVGPPRSCGLAMASWAQPRCTNAQRGSVGISV